MKILSQKTEDKNNKISTLLEKLKIEKNKTKVQNDWQRTKSQLSCIK